MNLINRVKEYFSRPILIMYPAFTPQKSMCKLIMRGRDHYFSFAEYDKAVESLEKNGRALIKTNDNKILKISLRKFMTFQRKESNLYRVKVNRQNGFEFNISRIADDKGVDR